MAALAHADLEFAQTTADAGEVKAGMLLSHEFTFVNRGPEVVEITGIESSCGCMTPRLDRRTFQPGERGSILVEVNTLSPAPGPHTWQIKVTCQSGDEVSNTPLRVTARLVREIVVEPAAVNMIVDGPLQTELRLTDPRSNPLQLQEVHTTMAGLRARLAGSDPDGSGHLVYRIQLLVGGDIAEGRHEDFVSLFTNDPGYQEIKVPVSIVKRPRQRLSAAPSRIELPLRPGVSSRMVLIRDRDNQEVEVEAVSADNPAISCRWAKGPGTMSSVRIQVDPERIQNSNEGITVRVQVAKPVRQTLLIPLMITAPQ
jgi:hypothetical protein